MTLSDDVRNRKWVGAPVLEVTLWVKGIFVERQSNCEVCQLVNTAGCGGVTLAAFFLGQVMLVMMSLLLWHLHHFHLDVRRRFLHLSLGPQLVGWLVCFQQGNTCSSLDSWCSSSSTSVWWTIKQLKFQFHVVDNLVFLLESKYRETNHWCPSIDCIIVCCCVAPK